MIVRMGIRLRAALYVRVSTEDQAREGYSLDAQQRRLEAYCRMRNWEISGLYRDEGYSGRSTDRPEYQRMMEEDSCWDILLVLKMDRIHRNSVNFALMMDGLRKKGKEFNSLQEKFDTTTAMGRFVMDTMQRIAQLESEQIGERVKIGMKKKAETGDGMLGSGHPYGYVYHYGQLKVVENEAQIVREMYDLYSSGSSMGDIADALNNRMIPAKRSGRWNKQSVCNILHNPLYIGYVDWDGIVRKGTHQSIVSREVYEEINGEFKR